MGSENLEIYRGHEGVRDFWRGWLDAWSEIDFEVEELYELEDRRIAVFIAQRSRGHGAGIWVTHDPYCQLWTLRDGLVTRC